VKRWKKRLVKKHLSDGSCKAGERCEQVEHRRFIELDYDACLNCARICGCADCDVLRRDFGARKAA
jgi:hypothetical protein